MISYFIVPIITGIIGSIIAGIIYELYLKDKIQKIKQKKLKIPITKYLMPLVISIIGGVISYFIAVQLQSSSFSPNAETYMMKAEQQKQEINIAIEKIKNANIQETEKDSLLNLIKNIQEIHNYYTREALHHYPFVSLESSREFITKFISKQDSLIREKDKIINNIGSK